MSDTQTLNIIKQLNELELIFHKQDPKESLLMKQDINFCEIGCIKKKKQEFLLKLFHW